MEDYKLRRRGEPCLVPPVLGLYLKVVLSYARLGTFHFSFKKMLLPLNPGFNPGSCKFMHHSILTPYQMS